MTRPICALICLGVVLLAARGDAGSSQSTPRSPSLELGIFFRHLRGSPLNEGSTDPWDPSRQEYLRLTEWSSDGWAPKRLDVALAVSGSVEDASRPIERVRIAIAFKVGDLQADPQSHLTDMSHLIESSKWWPAEFVKVVARRDLVRRGDHLVVLEDLAFYRMYEDLWRSGLWPVEMEVRALVDWKRNSREGHQAYETHLRIVPGD